MRYTVQYYGPHGALIDSVAGLGLAEYRQTVGRWTIDDIDAYSVADALRNFAGTHLVHLADSGRLQVLIEDVAGH